MPSVKDLKKRIGTVKNTQQTTRAMKMVSAAKLRRAQEAIQNQRPYAKRILDLIRQLSTNVAVNKSHPMARLVSLSESIEKKRVLLVLVSSDRGLCGGFNSNVIKSSQQWSKANSSFYEFVEMSFVGRRSYDFFKNKKVKIGTNYHELGGKVTFVKAETLAKSLIDRFLNDEIDEVKFIYNEFKNAVTQKTVVEDFLPLKPIELETSNPTQNSSSRDYIVKPSPEEVLVDLLERNFAIQAFRILLESQAGEHGARMSAMENATKNAGEMIKKLTLQYNKQRQAGITKELLEIISGSESQKG